MNALPHCIDGLGIYLDTPSQALHEVVGQGLGVNQAVGVSWW